MRKTAKYLQACELLAISPDAGYTHANLYRQVSMRGFEWRDGRWQKSPAQHPGSVEYRVIATPDDIDEAVLSLMESVEERGWVVEYCSGDKPAKHGKVRVYVRVRP